MLSTTDAASLGLDGSANAAGTGRSKHRADGDSRTVPAHPELAKLLRVHLRDFAGVDGRLVGLAGHITVLELQVVEVDVSGLVLGRTDGDDPGGGSAVM